MSWLRKASLSLLALGGGCFLPPQDPNHPEFAAVLGRAQPAQTDYMRTLAAKDQVAFFLYDQRYSHPPNEVLRYVLAQGDGEVLDELIIRLNQASDDADMWFLSSQICMMFKNGAAEAGFVKRSREAVAASASRVRGAAFKADIERCARALASL